MIPVYQTRTVANDGSGNCFNACVASILEMPLRDVCSVLPDFDGDDPGEEFDAAKLSVRWIGRADDGSLVWSLDRAKSAKADA